MRVLVTGASAPIGLALVDRLASEPTIDHVLAVGLEPEPPRELVRAPHVTYAGLDLTKARAVHDLLFGQGRALGIDAVVHGPLHRSARDRGHRVHLANVELARQLVIECERQPAIRRFVYRGVGDVYAVRETEPNLLDEDAPFELDPSLPQWIRDRVEADLTTCAHLGSARLSIAILRCAEVLAAGTGSQLWDYLQSRVCLRPLGFDPMINVLSIEDQITAIVLALRSDAKGAFNIPGADTLPLSRIIALAGRLEIPVPGPLLAPLYHLRTRTVGLEFRYDLNLRRFHFGGMLEGSRARERLGYVPSAPLWPHAPQSADRTTSVAIGA
ncbi:MAG TPA: NAD-dependent epimerase/dehydratase family protein [Kofleriaceae bacterium]|nr:NAD-dependent epimerase/dehydratase family protein [Kofleriaceae bacterium]